MGGKRLHYSCNQVHVLKVTGQYKLALKTPWRAGEVAARCQGYNATGDTHLKVRARGQVPQPKRHTAAT